MEKNLKMILVFFVLILTGCCSVATVLKNISQDIYDILDTVKGTTQDVTDKINTAKGNFKTIANMSESDKKSINEQKDYYREYDGDKVRDFDDYLKNYEDFYNYLKKFKSKTVTMEQWDKILADFEKSNRE